MTLSPRAVFSIVGWASPLAVVLFLGCGAKTAPALKIKAAVVQGQAIEGPGVEEALDARISAEGVREALETLPERQRLTVIMKVLEERTHAEVAEILGSNVGTVKANLFFAIRNLRQKLATALPSPRGNAPDKVSKS